MEIMVKDPIKNKVADLARIHGLDKTNAWIGETVNMIPKRQSAPQTDETDRLLVLMRQVGLVDQETFGAWMSQHLSES